MNTLGANGFQSCDWNEAVVLGLVLLLSLLLLRPRASLRPRAQPVLLELAATRPDERVSVIVYKAMTDSSVEERVARLGGAVTRDLRFIDAFAAELPAHAVPELARAEGVRWVSLVVTNADAPVTLANPLTPPGGPGHPPGRNEIGLDVGRSRNPPAGHPVHN